MRTSGIVHAAKVRARITAGGPAALIARKRRNEITAILRDVCGGPCETDDGIVWLDEVLPLIRLITASTSFRYVVGEWARLHTPLLSDAEIDDSIERIIPAPPRYDSASIGNRLSLTEERRRRLGITHILPAGWTKEMNAAARRARNAAAVKAKRQAKRALKAPRAVSIRTLAPWVALRMSRATFMRLSSEKRAIHVAQARNLAAVSGPDAMRPNRVDDTLSFSHRHIPVSPCPKQSEGEGSGFPFQAEALGREDRVGPPQPDQDTAKTAEFHVLAENSDVRTAPVQPEELGTVSSHPRRQAREDWPDPSGARGRPASTLGIASADFRLTTASGLAGTIQTRPRARCPPAFRLPPPSSSFLMPLGFLR